jgi:hypothetical protein
MVRAADEQMNKIPSVGKISGIRISKYYFMNKTGFYIKNIFIFIIGS